MTGRPRREERGGQGRLPCAGLARDHDSTALLYDGPEEPCRGRRERVARDQLVERDVAHGVPPHRRRQPVGDGRYGGCETRGAVEHARLHHRVLGVQLTLGLGEHPVEDLAVLVLGGRLSQSAQSSGGVEVRDPRALDEDLFHVDP